MENRWVSLFTEAYTTGKLDFSEADTNPFYQVKELVVINELIRTRNVSLLDLIHRQHCAAAQIIPLASNQELFKEHYEAATKVIEELKGYLTPWYKTVKAEVVDPKQAYESVFGSLDTPEMKQSIEEAEKYLSEVKSKIENN